MKLKILFWILFAPAFIYVAKVSAAGSLPYSDLAEHVGTLVALLSLVFLGLLILLWRIISKLEQKTDQFEAIAADMKSSLLTTQSTMDKRLSEALEKWFGQHHNCREWQLKYFTPLSEFRDWTKSRSEFKKEILDAIMEVKREMERYREQIGRTFDNHQHDEKGRVVRSDK